MNVFKNFAFFCPAGKIGNLGSKAAYMCFNGKYHYYTNLQLENQKNVEEQGRSVEIMDINDELCKDLGMQKM